MPRDLANPGPLGLCAFGLTTVTLNMHNAGWFPMTSLVLGMGLVYGGFMQAVVGVLEYINGNTFGMVAFASYGSFWMSFGLMKILPKADMGEAPSDAYIGAWLLLWGIFTAIMTVGTLRSNYCLIAVFTLLTVLFVMLAAADFSHNEALGKAAGWEGLVCGSLALYLGCAEAVNASLKKDLFPIGKQRSHVPVEEEPLKVV